MPGADAKEGARLIQTTLSLSLADGNSMERAAVSPALPESAAIRAVKRADRERAQALYFTGSATLPDLFSGYVAGVGRFDDRTWGQIGRKIDAMAVRAGLIPKEGSVFDPARRIRKEHLEAVCPIHADAYFDVGPANLVTDLLVFGESANEHQDLTLPTPMGILLHRARRPAVRLYSIDDADLYLHPLCYQVLKARENWFFPSASSRSCSRVALDEALSSAPAAPAAEVIVIVQDRFPATDIAHFLFDSITRLGIFCESGVEDLQECLFVLGGAPGAFEKLLLRALALEYGLAPEQFLFPSNASLVHRAPRLYWFSDQVESYLHPAQMAHPRSVDVIRRVAARLPRTPRHFRRLYISQNGAARQRLSNEPEICRSLGRYGFEPVLLADFSIEARISLIAGAECVVSPHGPGLTHLALHPGSPALVELHQPGIGTDAYAFMAKAMGCHYQLVMGTRASEASNDYAVPVDAIVTALGAGAENRGQSSV